MAKLGSDKLTNRLVSAVKKDPNSLLQILLAVSDRQVRERIVGSPAYPSPTSTPDLPERVSLFKEALALGERSSALLTARMYAAAVDLSWRKNYGQFFTPYEVAKSVVKDLRLKEGDVIVDAGSGTGIFAAAVLELHNHSASKMRYLGVEIDPVLTLCGAITLQRLGAPANWQILYRNFLRVNQELLSRIGIKTVHAVIANPPFVRYHRISDKASFVHKLEQNTSFSLTGFSGAHSFFLAHATTLIDRGGRIGFLFPIGISEVGYGANLLKQIGAKFEYSERLVSPELKLFIFRRGHNHIAVHVVPTNQVLLEEFLKVHRGISTGANSFFVLSGDEVERYRIPSNKLTNVLPTKSRMDGFAYTREVWEAQRRDGKHCFLLVIDGKVAEDELPTSVRNYLRAGESRGVPLLWTCKSRKPWYAVRQSDPPDLIFTYISRNPRFVHNSAGVRILTNVLGAYLQSGTGVVGSLKTKLASLLTRDIQLWMKDGNHGRRYSRGLIKFEPGDLRKLPLQMETVKLLKGTRTSLTDFV